LKLLHWNLSLAVLLIAAPAYTQVDSATRQLAHDIFKQLVEINTTDSVGNVTTAAQAMAQRFRDAGFPESDIQVLGPNDRKKNLVVRLHGSGRHRPILLISHLDVVEAHREDWTTDPFQFVEKDGYYYGRGAEDIKDGDAVFVTALIHLKQDGYVPDRDLILALTADEEGGKSNGVDWLLKNHRELIDADFVLNHDAGNVVTVDGKPSMVKVEATEKLYADFVLTVTNPGGHSSRPVPDNSIYRLARALVRLEEYRFPFELNDVTRAYYLHKASIESGQRAADMKAIQKNPADPAAIARLSESEIDNAIVHTTCVATRVNAGHANNALPQRAQAIVNCRILPGHSSEDVRQVLIRVVDDPKITLQYMNNAGEIFDRASERESFAPSPLRPDVFGPLEKIANEMWPGGPVVPLMELGASDAVYTMAAGMPTYGVSGIAMDRDESRAHGKDERVGVESFYRGVEFYYRYLKALTQP
jgi:acetylornithine deacetylase/succinyl-diaminopimelate desuccinylase-like protein